MHRNHTQGILNSTKTLRLCASAFNNNITNNSLKQKTMRTHYAPLTRTLTMGCLWMMMWLMMPVAAAAITITGTITDENRDPMPGVSVLIKGTSRGVISNINGHYTLEALPHDLTLVFAFIGYETQEVPIQNRTTIDVQMKPDNQKLEEVVVMSYGAQKKRMIAKAARKTPPSVANVMSIVEDDVCIEYEMVAQPDFNTENYATVRENDFKSTASAPLSTFSVDVDRAAYANVRRFLNNGQLPPVDAVRIEEMVNYFAYNYPQPEGSDPFAVQTHLAVCPWNARHLMMKIGLKGREFDKSKLPPSNLVFLMDVSGSMDEPNKLPLLKASLRLLVNELRPSDRIAMVVYAGAAGLVLPSTPGNQKQTILDALDRLQAGGSTAGGAGLKLAYEVARQNFIAGGNNRIVLATDGDFNVGQSSNAEMERLVEKERQGGTAITVLGFGMGNYKDDRMEIIANKGNGNYAYIDNLQEAEKTLVKEFGGTLFTIAKDVKLQLEFNPARVAAYRLIGYENRLLNNEDFNNDQKDAGEIGAGHTVTALYEIVPVGAPDAARYAGQTDALKYQQVTRANTDAQDWLTVKLRYKQPDGDTSRLMERPVTGTPEAFDRAHNDLQFAAGVAAFGMMLRNSPHKGSLTWNQVTQMTEQARGDDPEGYRAELVRLVKMAAKMNHPTE